MITETSTDRNTFTDVLAGEGPSRRMTRQRQKEMKVLGKNWKELQQLAEKRRLWMLFVDGPCSNLEPRA